MHVKSKWGILTVVLCYVCVCLTSPTAWNRKVSVHETLASSTVSLISSKTSNMETSRPEHPFAE